MSITRVDFKEHVSQHQAGINAHLRLGPVNFRKEPLTRLSIDSSFTLKDGTQTIADIRSFTSDHRSLGAQPRETTGVSWTTAHPHIDSFGHQLHWSGVVDNTREILRPGQVLTQPMTGDRMTRPQVGTVVLQPGPGATRAAINVRDPKIGMVFVAPENPHTTIEVTQRPGGQAAILFTRQLGVQSRALENTNRVAAQLSPNGEMNLEIEGAEAETTLGPVIIAAMASGRLRVT